MQHRNLTHEEFTTAAIEDILARGKLPDWVLLITAIRDDPYGDVAEKTLSLCEQPLYGAPVFRRILAAARQSLMFAGLLAGIGFGNSGCHLPHAMSYPVSSPAAGKPRQFRAAGYPDDEPLVPHGIAVVVNAPAALRFTADAAPQRHRDALRALGDGDAGDAEVGGALAERLSRLMREADIPNGLTGIGYGEDDIDLLAAGAFKQKRLVDNAPLAVGIGDLKAIYRQALSYW